MSRPTPDAYLVQVVLNGECWEHRWWVPRWGDPDPTVLDGTAYQINGVKHPDMGTYRVKPFYADAPQAVPAGWRLVPELASEEQLRAVLDTGVYHDGEDSARAVLADEYRTMVAAGPSAPPAPGIDLEQVKRDAEIQCLDGFLRMAVEPVGQQCCGRAGLECCGDAIPVYATHNEVLEAMQNRMRELIDRRDAAPGEA